MLSFLSYFSFHFSVSSLDVFYLFLSIVLSFLPFSWTNIRREDSESLLEIKTRKIKAHETSRKLSVISISSFFYVLVLCCVPISLPSRRLLCYLLNHHLFTESRWVWRWKSERLISYMNSGDIRNNRSKNCVNYMYLLISIRQAHILPYVWLVCVSQPRAISQYNSIQEVYEMKT